MSNVGRPVGRYLLFDSIAAGGIGSVHLGRMQTEAGFWRTVVLKRLHPHFAESPEMVAMLVDEARLATRVRHVNVVPTLDVVVEGGETLLVMEYVAGESLARLVAGSRGPVPPPIASAIAVGFLLGLHAAHEATDEDGTPLGIVHRDVSPQNVLVGSDGIARVLDFGIAKARGRLVETTREGQLKGKLAYMAPEQLAGSDADRRIDVFTAGIVLWECLAGRRLFRGRTEAEVLNAVLAQPIPPPTELLEHCPAELDEVVLRALSRNKEQRYPTALEFARDLERVLPLASQATVADWVARIAGADLAKRASLLARIEQATSGQSYPVTSEGKLPNREPEAMPAVEPEAPTQTDAAVDQRASQRGSELRRSSRVWGWLTGAGALVALVVLVGLGLRARTAPNDASAPPPARPALSAARQPVASAASAAPTTEPSSAAPMASASAPPLASTSSSASPPPAHAWRPTPPPRPSTVKCEMRLQNGIYVPWPPGCIE